MHTSLGLLVVRCPNNKLENIVAYLGLKTWATANVMSGKTPSECEKQFSIFTSPVDLYNF